MKHAYSIIIFLILFYPSLNAQTIKGSIKNQSGEPIPYATVYIRELKQGTTTNTKGDYEIRLQEGSYTVTYQSMGYELISIDFDLKKGQVYTKDVVLPLQYYQIPEVRISASGEDPAYIVMRKVIGMAPYYLNNVKSYKAEVYLKGNLVINRIPKILQKQMTVQQGRDGKEVKLKRETLSSWNRIMKLSLRLPTNIFRRLSHLIPLFLQKGMRSRQWNLSRQAFMSRRLPNLQFLLCHLRLSVITTSNTLDSRFRVSIL